MKKEKKEKNEIKTLRDYELMVIVPSANDEKKEKYQEKIKKIFSKNNILIKEEKELYTKQFYHPINKTTEGIYYLYNLQADPSSIVKTEKEFLLNQNILRFQYIRISK